MEAAQSHNRVTVQVATRIWPALCGEDDHGREPWVIALSALDET